jgi:CoA:oxalate CoA-transferase
MKKPLEGIRVLDLTWVLSGPFATMVLSDLGAEVIKVERPKVGDIARGNGPYVKGVSTYFISLNRGKKSLVLDLTKPRGREIILKLAEKADVMVSNYVPGTMERLGVGYEVIKKVNPRMIYAMCSGFGQYGPYTEKPAFDVIIQAMGGIISITGEPGRPPVKPGASLGDITAGLFLSNAILAAIQERHNSGLGQMIDISMLDCQLALLENAYVRYFATGEVPEPLGTRHAVSTPFQVFPTKDGYVAIAIMGGAHDQWPIFCAVIGRTDIIDDKRFETNWTRTQNYAVLEPIMNEAFKKKTTAEWLGEFEVAQIACGPVNTIDMVAKDPQVAVRDMFIDVRHHTAGDFKVVNTPVKYSRTPCKPEEACPDLGENSEELLQSILGMTPAEIEDLRKSGII